MYIIASISSKLITPVTTLLRIIKGGEVKQQVNAQAKTLEELAEREKELGDKVTKIMMTIPSLEISF